MLCFDIILLLLTSIYFIVAEYNQEHLKVLHITDLHYDVHYRSNASIYSFCHRNSTDYNDEKSNSMWGRECDSSGSLIQKSLINISKRNHNISVILLTGDNIR